MCFRAILYAVFHSIRLGFEGSKLKMVDQRASDGRVSKSGFQFLRWLRQDRALLDLDVGRDGKPSAGLRAAVLVVIRNRTTRRVFWRLAGVVFWPRLFWLCVIGTRILLRFARKK